MTAAVVAADGENVELMWMMCVAAIHDRYLPDTQLLQRLHHRIHHGNHLYTDVGLIDSDSVLQVPSILN